MILATLLTGDGNDQAHAITYKRLPRQRMAMWLIGSDLCMAQQGHMWAKTTRWLRPAQSRQLGPNLVMPLLQGRQCLGLRLVRPGPHHLRLLEHIPYRQV